MEQDLDHVVWAPWLHPYHRMTINPYLTSTVQGQYTNFGNVVSLHLDPRPGCLHGSPVRPGILKPKAVRVSSLHPFINASLCQGRLDTHLQEVGGRRGDTAHSCSQSPIYGVSAQLNSVYPPFPYLSPCPYELSGHSPLVEAHNMLKDIILSQKQLMYIHGTPLGGKYLEASKFAAGVGVLRASQRHALGDSDCFHQNYSHIHRQRPKTVPHKCSPLTRKVCPKVSPVGTRHRESARNQLYVKTQRHASLNAARKRFMTPFSKTVIHETQTHKKSDKLKHSANKPTEHPNVPEDVRSQQKPTEHPNVPEDVRSQQKPTEHPNIPEDGRSQRAVEARYLPSDPYNNSPADRDEAFLGPDLPQKRTEAPLVVIDSIPVKRVDTEKLVTARIRPCQMSGFSQVSGFSDERKSFRCPQCRYLTDRKNNLKRHIVTMHQTSSKVLECCGASFQNKAALRDHNSIYHRGGYKCQVCTRNFCRKALLRRHLTVHSGQKDFFCNICGYATSHKSNLERHQKVHTKRETAADSDRKSVSIILGVRLRPLPAFPSAVPPSRRHKVPQKSAALDSNLFDHEPVNSCAQRDNGSKQNVNKTNSFLLENPADSLASPTTKELGNNSAQNTNAGKSRSLQLHNFLEINVSDKWDSSEAGCLSRV